jgi:hypothetical protein
LDYGCFWDNRIRYEGNGLSGRTGSFGNNLGRFIGSKPKEKSNINQWEYSPTFQQTHFIIFGFINPVYSFESNALVSSIL